MEELADSVAELRSDWSAGGVGVSVAAVRWRQPKSWGRGALTFRRDGAWEMLVGENAHKRLTDILRTVESVDDAVQAGCVATMGKAWNGGMVPAIMRQIHEGLRAAGAIEGGPTWIAGDRAAARALQKRRDRWKAYGWPKPYGAGEIVHTVRLPFGSYYRAPLMMILANEADDALLLGRFAIRPLPGSKPPRWAPEGCSYAEAALLNKGWRIRFVFAHDENG